MSSMPDVKPPDVKPKDRIRIGARSAVVCTVHPERIEVVYLDDGDRAIHEDAHWIGSRWDFVHSGPVGRDADRDPCLAEVVSRLRHGR